MIDFFAAIKPQKTEGNKIEKKRRENYEKYKWFFTSSNKLVIGGKNAEQNEEIMSQVENDDVILHTSSPGSPFCIIKNPAKKDIEEAAIYTACFSHEWKRGKTRAEVHIFRGEQVTKNRGMKPGTFGVQGSIERKKVILRLALDFQKGKLRGIPPTAAKKKTIILTPGKMDKLTATDKILDIIRNKYNYPISKEEIMSAIPSDNIEIKNGK